MKRFLLLFQFLPVALFLYFARVNGWYIGFLVGSAAAVLEFVLLFYFKVPVSRLLGGANLFLIYGAAVMYFQYLPGAQLLMIYQQSAIFFFILVFVIGATILTKGGAFENYHLYGKKTLRYSVAFIACVVLALLVSYHFRGDNIKGGVLPFVALIAIKAFLQRRLLRT